MQFQKQGNETNH